MRNSRIASPVLVWAAALSAVAVPAAAQAPASEPSVGAAISVAKGFVRHARAGLARYAQGCLKSPSCRLTAEERTVLERIVGKIGASGDWPTVAFDETRVDSDADLARWANAMQARLLFPPSALVRKEPQGGYEPVSIFRAAGEMIVQIGQTIPGLQKDAVMSAAHKLQDWLREQAEVTRLGPQRRLVAIDLGDQNAFTELLLADDSDVIRLDPLIASNLTCPDGTSPTGARVWSVHWAHGIPGPIFRQPVRGRLNLFCKSGDKLGDDVLFEMNFSGDHLVSRDITVRVLECSKLGCYPKRDASGVP